MARQVHRTQRTTKLQPTDFVALIAIVMLVIEYLECTPNFTRECLNGFFSYIAIVIVWLFDAYLKRGAGIPDNTLFADLSYTCLVFTGTQTVSSIFKEQVHPVNLGYFAGRACLIIVLLQR
jgi:hypothetical protein